MSGHLHDSSGEGIAHLHDSSGEGRNLNGMKMSGGSFFENKHGDSIIESVSGNHPSIEGTALPPTISDQSLERKDRDRVVLRE